LRAFTPSEKRLHDEHDAVAWIEDAVSQPERPDLILIPVDRLDDEFFRLRTGMAGQILQKFVTYHFRVAIIGDISRHTNESATLRDFVYESNSGCDIWFAATTQELQELEERNR
jgi:uncharacterized protein DUF4180